MANIIKRQIEDFVISDLLPIEKPHYFTNNYFYEYILDKVTIDKNFDEKTKTKPIEYLTNNKNTFRKLGIINPVSMINTIKFMKRYQHDLIALINDIESFSIRKPTYNNSLSYIDTQKQVTYYKNNRKQFLISLESSGIYFNHYIFKRFDKYLTSFKYLKQVEKYRFQTRLDIQDFFGSVYTHSFKWLLSNDFNDSLNITKNDKNTVFPNIDKHLQNINGGKTRGIIIGPEFSRMATELLMVNLDNRVKYKLLRDHDLEFQNDYEISRFIDDYVIYYNDENVFKTIKNILEEVLRDFHFLLKTEKEATYSREDNFLLWKSDLRNLLVLLDDLLNGSRLFNQVINEIKRTCINYGSKFVTSYLLSGIVTKLETLYKEESYLKKEVKTIGYDNLYGNIYEFIEEEKIQISLKNIKNMIKIIFQLLSLKANFMNSEKVIRSLDIIIKICDKNVYQKHSVLDLISEMVDNYSDEILSGYTVDWVNLFVYISNLDIDINSSILEKMRDLIMKKNKDILSMPGLLMIYNSYNYKKESIKREVNLFIKEELEKITINNIENEKECWIIFIFNKSPFLNKINARRMNVIANKVIEKSEKEDVKSVFNFINNNATCFINWDITELYNRDFFYYTRDRTVFNPKETIDVIGY
ncbi:RNA-directed DNA polymerase [Staphylococcus equorum]|uniref:RNA-directed DNA polymerase n=1 Tax=Staphylococcus equorum TaxID=246432 RepID=UPI0039810221